MRATARTDRLGVVPIAGQAAWQRDRTRHAVGSTAPRSLVRYVLLAGVFGLFGLAIVLLALLLSDGRGAAPLVIQAPADAVTAPPPAPVEAPRPSAAAPPARPAPARAGSREKDDDSSGGSGRSSAEEKRLPGEAGSEFARDMARDWTGLPGRMPGFSGPGLP